MSGGRNMAHKATRVGEAAHLVARPRLTQSAVERKRIYSQVGPSSRVVHYSRLVAAGRIVL